MPTAAWIVIGIFAFGVVVGLVTRMMWSISTQHRDHGAVSEGPVTRRRIRAPHPPRAHAGPMNPEAIPGATATDRPTTTQAPPPARRAS